METKKLPGKTKLGYAIGQIGTSVPYNLVIFYLLFFFTDVAGIEPGFAGTIFLIAVLWAAIADPTIGIISDNLRTRFGRRRPILLIMSVFYMLVTFLLFTVFDFSSDFARNAYFVIMAILWFTGMTCTEVPLYSLGAEITKDFDERTSIRALSSLFVYVSVLIAVNLPNLITSIAASQGATLQTGWSITGLACGIIASIAILIAWKSTKGRELIVGKSEDLVKEKPETQRDGNLFTMVRDTFKVKPVKFIVLANMFYLFGFSCLFGVKVYILTYITQATALQQSLILSVLPICTMLWIPVINLMGKKLGKRNAYILNVSILMATLVVFMLIGNYSIAAICIFDIFFSLGNGTFWTMCFAMAYDTAEVDEFINNKRREGLLTSYMSFAQKVGTALSLWITGQVLAFVGYVGTAEVQTERAISGLLALFTWFPLILFAISVLCVVGYPITKKKHEAVRRAIEQRKNGEEPDTSAFKDLL